MVLIPFLVLAFFDSSSCRLRSALAGSGVPRRNSFRAVHRGTPQDLVIRYAASLGIFADATDYHLRRTAAVGRQRMRRMGSNNMCQEGKMPRNAKAQLTWQTNFA